MGHWAHRGDYLRLGSAGNGARFVAPVCLQNTTHTCKPRAQRRPRRRLAPAPGPSQVPGGGTQRARGQTRRTCGRQRFARCAICGADAEIRRDIVRARRISKNGCKPPAARAQRRAPTLSRCIVLHPAARPSDRAVRGTRGSCRDRHGTCARARKARNWGHSLAIRPLSMRSASAPPDRSTPLDAAAFFSHLAPRS